MTINQLVEELKSAHEKGYTAFGIRSISDQRFGHLEIGESVPDSYDWDMENDMSTYHTTGATLGGACAVGIATDDLWLDGDDDDELMERIESAINMSNKIYNFGETMLIGGNGYDAGWDKGEYIISDAVVLAVID